MAKITIEVGDSKNRNPVFNPTQEKLRGRWKAAYTPRTGMHESLAALCIIPEIPGIQITVDIDERTCSRIDPLSLSENKGLWDTIDKILQTYPGQLGIMKPWPSVTNKDCTDDQIKDWLWYMRCFVDQGEATVIEGQLPTAEQIRKLPGARRTGYGGVGFVPEKDRWVDRVERGGGRRPQPVGAGAGGGAAGGGSGGGSGSGNSGSGDSGESK